MGGTLKFEMKKSSGVIEFPMKTRNHTIKVQILSVKQSSNEIYRDLEKMGE